MVRRVRVPRALTESRPSALAPLADLEDIGDDAPGIRRVRCGRGFRYVAADGATVRPPERDRLAALAVPPAWDDVWFCSSPRGYVQASGRDAAGRKQYRYHDRYIALRSSQKFERLRHFPRALVRLRRWTLAGLDEPPDTRRHAVAGVLRLLDVGLVRVGNPQSAATDHHGGTTLGPEHILASDSSPVLAYTGKGGVDREITVDDEDLAELLSGVGRRGGPLFSYAEGGERRAVVPEDVNAAIADCVGSAFTAKDFRTWGGSRAAFEARVEGAAEAEALDAAADALGNTRAVARSSYVHPGVLRADESAIREAWNRSRASAWRSRGDSGLEKVLAAAPPGFSRPRP